MAQNIVFYTNPQSRGRIARWALEEVGAAYETKVLDYGTSMKGADYLSINPMGKVPAIRYGDQVVTECAAICAFLADAFPDKGLAPPLAERGAYYRWLFFAAGPLEAAVINNALGFVAPKDREIMVGYGNMASVLDTLQNALTDNEYITSDKFTAADIYVGAQITWGLQQGTVEARECFQRYSERVTAREAYKKANALDDALVQ